MAQYFRSTLTIGATPFTSDSKWVDEKGLAPIANTSLRETAGVPCTVILHGPDGDTYLDVGGNGTRFRRLKRVSWFSVSGNGAVLIVDISGPDEYEEPSYLTISGFTQKDSAIQTASIATGAGNTTIYTAPAGYKTTILGGFIAANASTAFALLVGSSAPGQRSLADFKPAGAETIFFGPTAGAPSGDTPVSGIEYVPFTIPAVLLPGETLVFAPSSSVTGWSYSFRFLLEPL
ncbi:MAG: hypothetical protein L3K23_10700 [Thermoplasmata archaeon]|nr:hypothetical protein [Thermoplasmata archaeon]